MKMIACIVGGYSSTEISYDEQNKCFIAEEYQWGSVDDAEEKFVGEHPISQHDTIKALIHEGALSTVLRYYDELNVHDLLDSVLKELQFEGQSIWVKDMQNTQLMENKKYTYYQFTEGQFVVYIYYTYFLIEPMKSARADFMIIKELLENQDTIVYKYQWVGPKQWAWVKENLHENAKKQ